jgi:antitoxin component YwqK of YwqJK toxin-antitoxin module
MNRILLLFVFYNLFSLSNYSQTTNQFDNHGLKQGLWEYYQTDTLKIYHIGVRYLNEDNSDLIKKYPNVSYRITHKLIFKGEYQNDKRENTWILFFDVPSIDEELTRETPGLYKGDTVIYEHVYTKKIIKSEIDYRNGKIDGALKTYYQNQNIKSELDFVEDQPCGHMKVYYDNGQLLFSGEKVSGKDFYQVDEYYKTGRKKYEKKISVDFILDNYTTIKEVEQMNKN